MTNVNTVVLQKQLLLNMMEGHGWTETNVYNVVIVKMYVLNMQFLITAGNLYDIEIRDMGFFWELHTNINFQNGVYYQFLYSQFAS